MDPDQRKRVLSDSYHSQRRSLLEFEGNLSPDQENALRLVLSGKSIFLTGAAGTGKSFLTQVIIERLKQEERNVLVAASTGVASSIVKGVTLHSLLRLKPVPESFIQSTFEYRYDLDIIEPYWNKNNSKVNPFLFIKDDDDTHTQSYNFIEKDPLLSSFTFQQEQESTNDILINKDSEYYQRKELFFRDVDTWSSIDVLVIDEISMVSKNLFTALDLVARVARGYYDQQRVNLPFGGIQMILVGDFYQLPPVEADFSFNSPSWKGIEPVFLEKQHRQDLDDDLTTILRLIRDNVFENPKGSQDIDFVMDKLRTRVDVRNQIAPVTLVGTNAEADQENITRQIMIRKHCITTKKKYQEVHFHKIEENVLSHEKEDIISLIISNGTQVMCTRNIVFNDGTRIHNGMIGIVKTFVKNEMPVFFQNQEYEMISKRVSEEWIKITPEIPVVVFQGLNKKIMIPGVETDEYERKKEKMIPKTISIELPLIPAWAITIHKSQGLTFNQVKINLTKAFMKNQTYVALSRAKRLESISITGILPPRYHVSWKINRDVVKWTIAQKEKEQRLKDERRQRNISLRYL